MSGNEVKMDKKDSVIPVVIFHEGCPSHLIHSVESAKRFNDRVILLGNEDNKHITEEWYDCNKLDLTRYEEFKKVFENYSTYNDFFAIIVFKRYFVIYELMKKLGFDRVMMVESDLYTCANYSEIPFLKDAYAMVSTVAGQEKNYGWSSCCHCSYWTKEAMNDFLDFCYDTYTKNKALLLEKWEYHKSRNEAGGVCDMTLAYLWSRDRKNVLNSALEHNGFTIDQNLCDRANYTEDEYEYNNLAKIKKYVIKKDDKGNKLPYLVKKDKTLVRVYSIHCSGRGKLALPYFNKGYFFVCVAQLAGLLKIKLGAIKNKILK